MTSADRGKPLTVTIYMEPGSSLYQIDKSGLLSREYKYFQAYCDLGLRINLVSFAGRSELDYKLPSPDMRLLCNSLGLPDRSYQRRLHQVHALPILRSDVLQTRTSLGMRYALRARWAWGTPVLCRLDALWSASAKTKPGILPSQMQEIYDYERYVFREANHISVATELLARDVKSRAPSAASKITCIPNFVDCEQFQPIDSEKRYDLMYVGTLRHVKNLDALLEAVERTGVTIAMIGGIAVDAQGNPIEPEVEARLKARFGDLDGRIHWLGTISNDDLPAYLNQAKTLILCSHSEGFGRAIIEALACGIPVIGSNLGGPKSILAHEETGFLCEPDADSIAAAIKTVLSQPRLLERMGRKARQYALDNFSQSVIARREVELLRDVARRHPVDSAAKRVASYMLRKR